MQLYLTNLTYRAFDLVLFQLYENSKHGKVCS